MALRNLDCVGKLSSVGQLGIIDKGFCFSTVSTSPTLADGSWSLGPGGANNDQFTATITGLTEATYYYIRAYAINSIGIDYSDLPSLEVKTLGITNFPTITVYITNNGLPQSLFEIGTTSYLIVSGETIKNDETLFINGYLNQNSSPPPTSNPILAWLGYQATYSTAPNVTVNFSPQANDGSSWNMKQQVSYNCGSNPQYTILAATTIDAVFPYLWVLKSNYQSLQSYFNPSHSLTGYFYYEASLTPNPVTPYNGKRIEIKGNQTFMITPDGPSHKIMVLGYPAYYGNIQYRINGGMWTNPGNLSSTTVGTGPSGGIFGIVNAWTYSYNILQVNITSYSSIPIPFEIKFV